MDRLQKYHKSICLLLIAVLLFFGVCQVNRQADSTLMYNILHHTESFFQDSAVSSFTPVADTREQSYYSWHRMPVLICGASFTDYPYYFRPQLSCLQQSNSLRLYYCPLSSSTGWQKIILTWQIQSTFKERILIYVRTYFICNSHNCCNRCRHFYVVVWTSWWETWKIEVTKAENKTI